MYPDKFYRSCNTNSHKLCETESMAYVSSVHNICSLLNCYLLKLISTLAQYTTTIIQCICTKVVGKLGYNNRVSVTHSGSSHDILHNITFEYIKYIYG